MNDFVAIGDIATDAFIRLKDAEVHCKINNENYEICLPFAEKIPYESVEEVVAVGNASNAAVAAARLGLASALVTNIGSDDIGRKCLEALKNERVSTDLVSVHESKKTNYHYVLWYDNDRTILLKHESYDRTLPHIGTPKWVYFSSVGSDTLEYQNEVLEYLNDNPGINLAFQPGTFQIKESAKLAEVYRRTKILFCNIEEGARILGRVGLNVEKMLTGLRNLGPGTVVLTDGPKGAHSYDGSTVKFHATYPDPKPPYERTGAGDAFASTTVAAMCLGKSFDEAVRWGMINAAYVVQEVGAQKGLLTREAIEKLL